MTQVFLAGVCGGGFLILTFPPTVQLLWLIAVINSTFASVALPLFSHVSAGTVGSSDLC